MKLVKYEDNWADEMDIYGFHVLSDKTCEKFVAFIKRGSEIPDFSFNIGVGSNEDIEYSSVDELLAAFKITDISDEEAAAITKNFKVPYGQFPGDQLVEGIAWSLEEELGLKMDDLTEGWMQEIY